MFQQRQLSNHATSPAGSSNITCRIAQPHLSTCVTPATDSCNTTCRLAQCQQSNHATSAVESCNVTCRLEISPDDLFPFWKNFTKRRRRRSHARFVVVLLILLIILIYKERGLIINELRGVKLNGSSTVLSRLFNERFISNEKTTPWWPLICGKKKRTKAIFVSCYLRREILLLLIEKTSWFKIPTNGYCKFILYAVPLPPTKKYFNDKEAKERQIFL